jgi:hypothetical protein
MIFSSSMTVRWIAKRIFAIVQSFHPSSPLHQVVPIRLEVPPTLGKHSIYRECEMLIRVAFAEDGDISQRHKKISEWSNPENKESSRK